MSTNVKRIILGICSLINLCIIFFNPLTRGNNAVLLSKISINISDFFEFFQLNYRITSSDVLSLVLLLQYFCFGVLLTLFVRSMKTFYPNVNIVSMAFGVLFILFESYIKVSRGHNILVSDVVIRFEIFFLGLLSVMLFYRIFKKSGRKNKYKVK